MTKMGGDIKSRLLAVGKTQVDIMHEVNKIPGMKATPPQISNAISNPSYPKLVLIREIINDLLNKWEAAAETE